MAYRFWRTGTAAFALLCGIAHTPAVQANNYGESLAWQFRTTADRVNLAAIARVANAANGQLLLTTRSGAAITVGRRARARVRDILGA